MAKHVRFVTGEPVDVRDLIPQLSFITNPDRWGLTFRRGLFTIPEHDFTTIARAMNAQIAATP